MVKILAGVKTPTMMVFFQALNAHEPKSRDELYHSAEWWKIMKPFTTTTPPNEKGESSFLINVKDDVSLEAEGPSVDYLQKCLDEATNKGMFRFLASESAYEAGTILKSALDKLKG